MSRTEKEQRALEAATERRAKRKKEERGVYLLCASFFVFFLCMLGLGYYFIGYGLAGKEYRDLGRKYVIFEDTDGFIPGKNTAYAAEQAGGESDYPVLQIDFEGLSAVNEDFTGWIYVPGADCSYPLVQTQDNDYYLNRTFEGHTSNNGSIFIDYRDSAYLTGFNTFIYGHNMKNGSMFGRLKEYYTNADRIAQYPYFYVYLQDGTVLKYQIFSYYLTDGDSDSYDRPTNIAEETAYLENIKAKSSVKIEIEENRINTYATLSTCAGPAGSGQRFLVHGACVGIY
ncbi:MAG: class B sortase [Lachnospiraceae bacterium]|nr:class B sortase [Lachnospiraceae bacterium]